MLKFSDVTMSIQFDLSLGEKRLLELVNACVSHEMRNPINAILGMNVQLKELIPQLFRLIADELGIDSSNKFAQIKADVEKAMSV